MGGVKLHKRFAQISSFCLTLLLVLVLVSGIGGVKLISEAEASSVEYTYIGHGFSVGKLYPSNNTIKSMNQVMNDEVEGVTVGPKGYIYAVDNGGTVAKLYPNLSAKRKTNIPGASGGYDIIMSSEGTLYTASGSAGGPNNLTKINRTDLSVEGTITGLNDYGWQVNAYNGYVFIGDHSGYIYKVNPETMTIVNSTDAGSVVRSISIYNSHLYVLAGKPKKMNPSNLTIEASYKTAHIDKDLVAHDGYVYVAQDDGYIDKLDAETLNFVDNISTKVKYSESITVSNSGNLIVGERVEGSLSEDGQIRKINSTDMTNISTTEWINYAPGELRGEPKIPQYYPTLNGTVTDSQGNTLNNSTIIVEYANGNKVIATTTTNSTGKYTVNRGTDKPVEVIVSKKNYTSHIKRPADTNISFSIEKTNINTGVTIKSNNVTVESVSVSDVGGAGFVIDGNNTHLAEVTVKSSNYGIVVKEGAGTHKLSQLQLRKSALAGIKNSDNGKVTVEDKLRQIIDTIGNIEP